VVVLVGLLAAGLVWAFRTASSPEAQGVPQPAVQLKGEQTRVVVRHKGDPQVDLSAEEVQVTQDLQSVIFDRVERAAVFREGREFLYLSARQIVLNRLTNDFVAVGDVLVTSPSGDWLRSDYMQYLNEGAVLSFPRGVTYQLGGTTGRAKSLRYHVNSETIEMGGGVEVIIDTRSLPTPEGLP
jgi:LPS export ABC transporter protein LptC